MAAENAFVTKLKALNAAHALTLSAQGTAAQRLSLLSGAGVGTGNIVYDQITGQKVEVVSSGVVFMPEGGQNAV